MAELERLLLLLLHHPEKSLLLHPLLPLLTLSPRPASRLLRDEPRDQPGHPGLPGLLLPRGHPLHHHLLEADPGLLQLLLAVSSCQPLKLLHCR